MKIFGSSQYVRVESYNFDGVIKVNPDVQPLEEYLQLEVKSMWDFSSDYYTIYDGEFTYFIYLRSKSSDNKYHSSKRLTLQDITEEYKEIIIKKYESKSTI